MNSVSPTRTLLVLGRGSNLPTVWSNCLAGWWLSGAGNFWKLPFLLLGISLLYTGGMFLNDAFDVDFDRQRRPERPIPSGKITVGEVWRYGFGLLGLGILLLIPCGWVAFVSSLCLAFFIILYDFTHKFITASPWLMGACRFWVYIIAGATGTVGLNGFAIVGGVALAFYIVGLSYVARRETLKGPVPYWPLIFLALPIILALAVNTGAYRLPAIWISGILALWIARCIRTTLMGGEVNVGHIVSNLLAGIVLVDWLAVAPVLPPLVSTLIFLALFALTQWFQKFIPAT
jgi:hypothetical protein